MDNELERTENNNIRKKRSCGKFFAIVIPLIIVIAILLTSILLNWRIIIDINADNPITVNLGEEYSYGNASAHLSLGEKKLLPLDITIAGDPDTNTPGEYSVLYSSKFMLLNDKVEQKVIVVDNVAPEIELSGDASVIIKAGEEYKEPGYKSNDNIDGDITGDVVVEGSVDPAVPGDYVLSYISTDKAGNQTTITRTVTVEPKKQSDTVDPDQKTIYLTFDDGPSEYTDHLLDILKARNVKVTFFVTGRGDSSILKREADEGHTVAVHTYSHDYATIYSSDSDYWSDFKKMEDLIVQVTGKKTNVFRFPGGSSNTVSKNYSTGIMSRLAESMSAKGYQYYDWNISSGDAGGVTTSEAVYENVISDISSSSSNTNIVLQHDIKDFSIEAVDRIIDWGLANGYAFQPITDSTPPVHHGINN